MNRPSCRFCGGSNVIGNGYHVSRLDKILYKRWKCKQCRRTFSRRHWLEPERNRKKARQLSRSSADGKTRVRRR